MLNQNTSATTLTAASDSSRWVAFAGRLSQSGEAGRGELVRVADDLVDDVGLGGVERLAGVAQVLGRVEDPVAQRAVEVAQPDQAGGTDIRPTGEGV
jgi:hypothetical protein